MLAACGGADPQADGRRGPLSAAAVTQSSQTATDLYRFFVIAFGAAPGVTYMGQLQAAVNNNMSVKDIVNVFTTKPQFTSVYPDTMSNQEFAEKLVSKVVGDSASPQSRQEAVGEIVSALALPNWTRGDVIYAIFSNLASKPPTDPSWAGTSRRMANQVVFARHYTETMKGDTLSLSTLRAVVANVTEATDITGDLTGLIQGSIALTPRVASVFSVVADASLAYDVVSSFTVSGSDLDTAVTVTAQGCTGAAVLPGATLSELKVSCRPSRDGAIALSLTAGTGLPLQTASFQVPKPQVRMNTSLGPLLIELEPGKAPVTVNNFLAYVQDGFFVNTVFHRIISTFMAQGGGFTVTTNYVYKPPTRAPITLEKTTATGLSNTAKTIAMARTSAPDSATSQFFINLVDNPFLNAQAASDGNGYAVFGSVVTTPEVNSDATLAALKVVPVINNGGGEVSLPTNPPVITAISRVR